MALAVTDVEGANKLWAGIDKSVTEPPRRPSCSRRSTRLRLTRLGNFQFNSQFYWMMAQSWVK